MELAEAAFQRFLHRVLFLRRLPRTFQLNRSAESSPKMSASTIPRPVAPIRSTTRGQLDTGRFKQIADLILDFNRVVQERDAVPQRSQGTGTTLKFGRCAPMYNEVLARQAVLISVPPARIQFNSLPSCDQFLPLAALLDTLAAQIPQRVRSILRVYRFHESEGKTACRTKNRKTR